ncbi:ATP-binding protein [Kitasatospora sp. NPDC127111]|uniref:ATP-binding protein n=1 Tax=Kitasatospora sp. NPDC127111 TaxID=3345363 RepID=UPI00362CA381
MTGRRRPALRARCGCGPAAAPRACRLSLSARPGVVAECRAFTRAVLADDVPGGAVDDAVLLVSELVTNACRYSAEAGSLLLVRGPGVLRVEVSDSSPLPPTPHRPHHPDRPGGLGLHLVDRLARCWGWRRQGPGKVVWFELPM